MSTNPSPPVSDNDRLLLAAGFAFGVMTTLLVLALVLLADGTFTFGGLLTSSSGLIVVAGIVFTGILGIALYVLAFPGNREHIPIAADDERARE